MQFNSYIFILVFLPAFVILYHLCNRITKKAGKYLIILAGLVFYSFAGIWSFAFLLISCLINFLLSHFLEKEKNLQKPLLIATIVLNVGLLLYFKYLNFAISTINDIFNCSFTEKELLLPLGISFFTFQQIMYVVSVYKGRIEHKGISDYLAYILYFPKLIMGPLTDPVELFSQINDDTGKSVNWDNIASGFKLFSYGLFKKMILADTFSRGVNWGFMNLETATGGDMILVMLFYTFEIYFDFSGYTDMAVGVSRMINIELPLNFDSPYKATSIRDFWKRWHVSLTGFFTEYIYYPLGGNRKGRIRTYVNIMIVFLISGLWHGANLTFILWGALHGLLQVIERIFDKGYKKIFEVVRWIYTFSAVNVLWLLFRSESITQWHIALYKILTFSDLSISEGLIGEFIVPEQQMILRTLHLDAVNEQVRGFGMLVFLLAGFIICLVPENNIKNGRKLNVINLIASVIAFVWAFLCLSGNSTFVYFGF